LVRRGVELVGRKSSKAKWCQGQLNVPPLVWPAMSHRMMHRLKTQLVRFASAVEP
jgi:hypothetical protein